MGNIITSIETIVSALRILANDIESDDGVANAAMLEAAYQMEELCSERDLWKAEAERWKTISQTQTTQNNAHTN